ncbi:hypothetical protein BDR26DRAFT_871045, partial [Obelidium mucronatum]
MAVMWIWVCQPFTKAEPATLSFGHSYRNLLMTFRKCLRREEEVDLSVLVRCFQKGFLNGRFYIMFHRRQLQRNRNGKRTCSVMWYYHQLSMGRFQTSV